MCDLNRICWPNTDAVFSSLVGAILYLVFGRHTNWFAQGAAWMMASAGSKELHTEYTIVF